MPSIAATYPQTHEGKGSIPRLCRVLIGDWTDVPHGASKNEMTLHVTFKAHGKEVFGSVHVKPGNRWLRVQATPGWFCARALVYERKKSAVTHVAKVRLCHRKKERSLLWQVVGPDLSGSLPRELVLWRHH